MANGGKGGKAETSPLSELISELEHFVDVTEEEIISLKNDITKAKKLLRLSSELNVANEEQLASNQDDIQEENSTEKDVVESSLEDNINRILKLAEQVRNKAKTDENIKSTRRYSAVVAKTVPSKGGQAIAKPNAKKSEVIQKKVTPGVTLGRAKLSIARQKSTYRQDFHINRGRQPILRKISRDTKEKHDIPDQEKTSNLPSVNLKPMKLLKAELKGKNGIDKNKAVPVQRLKNSTTSNEGNSPDSFKVPKFLVEMDTRKSSLLEAILKKAETPKYKELLEGIKCYHRFQRKSGSECHDQEKKLKQSFLKKCAAMDDTSKEKNELELILEKILPFCGWAVGIESCPDINLLKKIMQEEKDNLEKIMSTHQGERIGTGAMFPSSASSDISNLKEYGIWNPSAVLPIFKGLEGLDYLQYESTEDQLSFLNNLHELQEHQLQMKIFRHIARIIAYYFENPQNFGEKYLGIENENCKRLLLKTLAVIADFSGHMRMPILASIEDSIITSGPTE